VGINGKPDWKWYLEWDGGPILKAVPSAEPRTSVAVDEDKAWKILTRWNDRSVYKIGVEGDAELGSHFLEMNCLLIRQ